jgi:glycine betaine/proline transport system substrate-binding protein
MLAQVARAEAEEHVVFLGWEPHPMNANFEMAYLSGGDDVFGPDFGGATVFTNVRAGYSTSARMPASWCHQPQVHAGDGERDHGRSSTTARIRTWPRRPGSRPTRRSARPWLDGVTTKDGGDGAAAVKAASG